jgi:hypothetical protein
MRAHLIRIRDLERSRDKWKNIAMDDKGKVRQLNNEIDKLKEIDVHEFNGDKTRLIYDQIIDYLKEESLLTLQPNFTKRCRKIGARLLYICNTPPLLPIPNLISPC